MARRLLLRGRNSRRVHQHCFEDTGQVYGMSVWAGHMTGAGSPMIHAFESVISYGIMG